MNGTRWNQSLPMERKVTLTKTFPNTSVDYSSLKWEQLPKAIKAELSAGESLSNLNYAAITENILFEYAVKRGDGFRQWFYPGLPEDYTVNPAITQITARLAGPYSAQNLADLIYAVVEGAEPPKIYGRDVKQSDERFIREAIKASAGLKPGWE